MLLCLLLSTLYVLYIMCLHICNYIILYFMSMFLIDYGTPDLFKSLFFEIIHKSALEQVTGY